MGPGRRWWLGKRNHNGPAPETWYQICSWLFYLQRKLRQWRPYDAKKGRDFIRWRRWQVTLKQASNKESQNKINIIITIEINKLFFDYLWYVTINYKWNELHEKLFFLLLLFEGPKYLSFKSLINNVALSRWDTHIYFMRPHQLTFFIFHFEDIE